MRRAAEFEVVLASRRFSEQYRLPSDYDYEPIRMAAQARDEAAN
jgi:hypothetical protein